MHFTRARSLFLNYLLCNPALFHRNLVEDQGDDGEEDWTRQCPEGGLVILFRQRLDKGKQDPDNQNQFHEDHQDIRPEAILEGNERPVKVLLGLEEGESPNQEDVGEGGGDVGHVRQDQVELLRGGTTKGHQEDNHTYHDGLQPHGVGRHVGLVELGQPLRPQVRVGAEDKGLNRRVHQDKQCP